MDTHQTDEAALLDLNMRSSKAENKHSRKMLEPILADDFRIVRAIWHIENR
jgi:hypothetical protein